MQRSLLPRSVPKLQGLELGAAYESSARVEVGGDVATVGPFVPTLPRNWKTLYESQVTQMIRVDRSLPPEKVN